MLLTGNNHSADLLHGQIVIERLLEIIGFVEFCPDVRILLDASEEIADDGGRSDQD